MKEDDTMFKVEIYDESVFKINYPMIDLFFSKYERAKEFEFAQCHSIDGVNVVVTYINKNNEDETANLEFNLNNSEHELFINED